MSISSPNPMSYHLLESTHWDKESSHWDDSNKWSNIEFDEEITKEESIEVHFTHIIWSPGYKCILFHNNWANFGNFVLLKQASVKVKIQINHSVILLFEWWFVFVLNIFLTVLQSYCHKTGNHMRHMHSAVTLAELKITCVK